MQAPAHFTDHSTAGAGNQWEKWNTAKAGINGKSRHQDKGKAEPQ
nr:hypothetical protein [Mucilaginibacter humi]